MFDRKAHWEKVYGSKSPLEVSWYQREPTQSMRLIQNAGVSSDAAIIDIGGGTSTLVDRLCAGSYTDLSVLDISSNALDHAKERLAGQACNVNWYNEDVVNFDPPQRFSVWHDRAVFHFLTDPADRARYVKVVRRILAPGGHLIIMAFSIGGPQKCSGLDIVQYDENKLLAELGEGFKSLEVGEEVHITPSGSEQKFAYFHFLRMIEKK